VAYIREKNPLDSFSARWSGRLNPAFSETYTFHMLTSHRARLWIDGKLLIDRWKDHDIAEATTSIALQAGKGVDIRMEYTHPANKGVARLFWSSPSQPKQIIPEPSLTIPDGHAKGVLGEYFDDKKLTRLGLTRTEPRIDFDWAEQGPFPEPPAAPLKLQLRLDRGQYRADWIDGLTGTVKQSEEIDHKGGIKEVQSPTFEGEIALRIKQSK
jgi:hypothetical protein